MSKVKNLMWLISLLTQSNSTSFLQHLSNTSETQNALRVQRKSLEMKISTHYSCDTTSREMLGFYFETNAIISCPWRELSVHLDASQVLKGLCHLCRSAHVPKIQGKRGPPCSWKYLMPEKLSWTGGLKNVMQQKWYLSSLQVIKMDVFPQYWVLKCSWVCSNDNHLCAGGKAATRGLHVKILLV